MSEFEFFRKEYKFQGKHARMVSELCTLNDYEHTFFKRAIDVYVVAAVIGFRVDRKAVPDYSPFEAKTIFGEQMYGAKEDLDFIMQMMLMLEPSEKEEKKTGIERAFRGVETKEEFDRCQKMFESYVLGGVEELYERLIIEQSEVGAEYADDKTERLMALFERFAPKELQDE